MRKQVRLSILSLVVPHVASCGSAGGETTGPQSPVTSLSGSPAELTLLVGSQQLTALARDEASNPLSGRSIHGPQVLPNGRLRNGP